MTRLLATLGAALLCSTAMADELTLAVDFSKPLVSEKGVTVEVMLDDTESEKLISFASTREGKQLFVYAAGQLIATQTVDNWMRVGHIQLSEWQDMNIRKAAALSDQIESAGEVTLAEDRR